MPHVDHYRHGVKLVSVTELQRIIAKPFLDKWKQSLCVPGRVCGFEAAKQVAEEAALIGNNTHAYVENWFKGIPSTPDAWGIRIVDKIVELGITKTLIEPEENILDEEGNLAGSPDFIGKDNSFTYIGDLKIKNSLDSLTGMQGAGYRYLIKRKFNVDIDKMLILWAQKKSKGLTVKPVVIDLNEWTEPWKHLVALWNVINPKRKVNIFE